MRWLLLVCILVLAAPSWAQFLRHLTTYSANPAASSQQVPNSQTASGYSMVVWNDNMNGKFQIAYSLFNATTLARLQTNFGSQERDTENPAVTGLSDRYVVVYSEEDRFLSDVFEVRYTLLSYANNTALRTDVKVEDTAADMRYPDTATLSTGQYVVVWEHNPQLLDLLGILVLLGTYDIRVRVFNADGTPASAAVSLTTNHVSYKPRIAALDNGQFVVTWLSGGRIYATILSFSGTAVQSVTNAFVALDAALDVVHNTVALGGADWLVTAQSSTGLWARAFTGSAAKSAKWAVASSTSARHSMATQPMGDGNLIVVWTDGTLLFAQSRSLTGVIASDIQVLANASDTAVSKAFVTAVNPWRINVHWQATKSGLTRVIGGFLAVRRCGDSYRDPSEDCDGGYGCQIDCTCPTGPQWALPVSGQTTVNCACQDGYLPSNGDCIEPVPDTPVAVAPITEEPPVAPNIIVEPPLDPAVPSVVDPPVHPPVTPGLPVTPVTVPTPIAAPNPDTSIVPNAMIVPPETGPVAQSDNLVIILPIIAAVIVAGLVLFLVLFLRRRRRQRGMKFEAQSEGSKVPSEASTAVLASPANHLQPSSEVPTKYTNIPSTQNVASVVQNNVTVAYQALKFNREIGVGDYGKVYEGEWQQTQVALKISTVGKSDDFLNEARLMVELRPHPNVLRLLGVSIDGPYPVLILEYCEGGSLDKLVQDSKFKPSLARHLELISGIARGMLHLHKNNIIHRDLAARNILVRTCMHVSGTRLTARQLSGNQPKISDFGLSRLVDESRQGTTRSDLGPVRWMAPESLRDGQQYSAASDVWSFGIVVWEVLSRQEPHRDVDPLQIAFKIRDEGLVPPLRSDWDPSLLSLIQDCLQQDAGARPSFESICNRLDRRVEMLAVEQDMDMY